MQKLHDEGAYKMSELGDAKKGQDAGWRAEGDMMVNIKTGERMRIGVKDFGVALRDGTFKPESERPR